MSRADYLLLCRRCRARIEFDTDGRGNLVEHQIPCVCPPGLAQPPEADYEPEPLPERMTYGLRQSSVESEVVDQIERMVDDGMTRERVAELLGYSASHVGYLYRLRKLARGAS